MPPLRLLLVLLTLTAAACPSRLQAEWKVTNRETLPAVPPLALTRLRLQEGDQTAELHLLQFRSDQFRLVLVDNPQKARRLGEALAARGAVAGVNGGYFSPEDAPLGLRVSGGQVLHPQERAKLLSGILFTAGGRLFLQRPAEFALKPTVQEALQAGPFLIDGGKPVADLNATRSATRTAAWVGPERTAGLLLCRSVTLAGMAEILATPGLLPEGGRIVRALNFDGGSSSGLWVAKPGGATPFYAREFKSVRDFVGLVPIAPDPR